MIDEKVEIVNTDIKYNRNDNDMIVSNVVDMFNSLDDDRRSQLTLIEKIQEILDPTEVMNTKDKHQKYFDESVKGKEHETIRLKDSSIKRILNTSIAHTYNSIFKSLGNIVSVEVEDIEDDNLRMEIVAKQKQALLNALRKSGAKKEFRQGTYNWFAKGELILEVNWKRVFKNIRRKIDIEADGVNLKKWAIQRIPSYDGVSIRCIDPEDFVFDTSRSDDFENAPKFTRHKVPVSDILSNESFKKFLSKEDLEEIKDCALKTANSDSTKNNDEEKGFEDGLVEIIKMEGDFNITKDNGDQEFLPNMKICIIGRKYVGYYAYNPNVISSYIYCPYEVDPDNGRGLPLLSGLISNSIGMTETLNKIYKAIGLSIYKCYIAPEGMFSNGVDVRENGIIPVDTSVDENILSKLKELDFQTGLHSGLSFLEFLKGESEEYTQRFKMSSGDSPKQARTLGENKMIMQGQNIIFSYENEKLLDRVVIPLFEKIGELEANFKDDPEVLRYKNQQGMEVTAMMDAEVRQANFTYIIIDMQTSTDKKMNNVEFTEQVLGKVAPYAQQQGKFINVEEMLTIIGSAYDQENPAKLLLVQPPPPQMGDMMNGQPQQDGSLQNEGIDGNAPMDGGEEALL